MKTLLTRVYALLLSDFSPHPFKKPDARGFLMANRTRRYDQMARERYLREALRDVHTDIESARAADAFTALSTLRRQAQGIRADLDAELAKNRARSPSQAPGLTSAEKQLVEIRKMRAAAEESSSWVAATTLMREERALSDEIAAERREAEAAARAEVSAEDLLGELASTILGLPEGARERLLEMVDEG